MLLASAAALVPGDKGRILTPSRLPCFTVSEVCELLVANAARRTSPGRSLAALRACCVDDPPSISRGPSLTKQTKQRVSRGNATGSPQGPVGVTVSVEAHPDADIRVNYANLADAHVAAGPCIAESEKTAGAGEICSHAVCHSQEIS